MDLHLKDAVFARRIVFNKAHNLTLYKFPDDRFNKLLNDAISSYSIIIMKKMLENYEGLEGVSTLVDIMENTGINPNVIKDAPTYRGTTRPFFKEKNIMPTIKSLCEFEWICHNWSDKHCLKLLKNWYAPLMLVVSPTQLSTFPLKTTCLIRIVEFIGL
ncbi:hypothetical protein Cgig2_032337 [Carnegiea gigantea]|uniref:O-methyltransferase C-terminal domain-containing protein n=1 Tax=Carnegiea gigantea TaxID=171969 RepID=A0A9Q1Q8V6_9CARY|nr:hypothetical protein Cgig2_032337 [Carnegiea gigantea]